MRPIIMLIAGLAVGATGALLFRQSLPPKVGSAEEKIEQLQTDLKKATNRLAALDEANPNGRRRNGRTLAEGARGIAEDLRDGKAVSPDDIFRASQPLIRDLSPLFDRVKLREGQRRADSLAGEMARKYGLDPAQQADLKQWFEAKAASDAKRFTALISQDGTKLDDIAKATTDARVDDGLDAFMANKLSGEKLTTFKADRMLEKCERVQSEADGKITRLDGIVKLDEAQKSQAFGVLARGSRDFDPAMRFEGLGTDTAPLAGKSKQDAILGILRPDQKKTYEADQAKRREDAQKDMAAMGLTLPSDWETQHSDF